MSRFFLDRPVFAWVVALLIMLAGVLSIPQMPVEQYPTLAPPQISVSTFYPGASADTVQNSVTQVIEQQLTGIDNLRYFSSSSDATGKVEIIVTLEPGTDPDIAQVQVQNKVQTAMPQLPSAVQSQGVVVEKASTSFLFVTSFHSTNPDIGQTYLADLVASRIQDPISRVKGVGSVSTFGSPYAMRVWLDPDRLYSYNISTNEVLHAISEQNLDVSAGQFGALPAVKGQEINATILAQSRLNTADQFRDIILRVNEDGSQVRLKDVSTISLGQETYGTVVERNGAPAAAFGVSLATGANALDTAKRVKDKLAELSEYLPDGVSYSFPYDTTPFVEISIESVVHTLLEAIVLVFFVMLLFLQNFRATLIPTLAVPVVLLGTFATLHLFGFTINTLTMFAMVLAIGLLVDDAIVVVENVERVMAEEGLSPMEATRKSMDQITGALIGIGMVLSAVFLPMAFFSGSAGAIYRQFSLTIVASMTFSVVVALILTPVLCATILKPVAAGHGEKTTGFFGWFNRAFNKARSASHTASGKITRNWKRSMAVYLMVFVGLGVLFVRIPTGFLPDEDQGVLIVQVSTPASATAARTASAVEKYTEYMDANLADQFREYMTVVGYSFSGYGQNTAISFVNLKDWEDRDMSVMEIAGQINQAMSRVKDAMIFAFFPPAIIDLGNASGFDLQLIDYVGAGHEKLMEARDQILSQARQNPKLVGVRPNGLDDVPMYKIELDMEKARALGLSIGEINASLQTAWGSAYVNDFMDNGRVKKVYVQGQAEDRMQPSDIDKWYVKNSQGKMVPFTSFSTGYWTYGSPRLERFNGYSSINIQGANAPGVSTGEAMAEMEKLAEELPDGIGYAWSTTSYEEKLSGSQGPALYAISIIIVFLSLAALYESWSIPLSVLLALPLGVLGSVVAALGFGLSNDVYFQVALLTTVGLCAKNAILIVEFAKELYESGTPLVDAALESFKLRFRPIIMTSMAFVLGVLPLAKSSGAGAASQNAIGLAIIGGMFGATFLAIYFVPLFFVFVERVSSFKGKKKSALELGEGEVN
ncbi:efflux RND transporter permease subunit [Desulfoluna spongiiphila]|uniref:Hydrophobic/amphiphilic exporter-1, HAE1 family/multidrug efflux pump n=1 Tax=Desulfoluna spongiiphila TaxID=419481 RepID=A0A1G5IRJ6_9BACT|nr:efflux RND transporter permease subunit [Desulfoluna spongiiphila]SCY78706.1 hydrophobic/amphiphilic exporter-1, HAE1 family/multidrug efflux pump [Desulfoluna spongiiphila]VVS92525.1 hydrophobe/amphiphile efflux-1 hae1 [Desulfoluna spongiiphila]